MNTPEIWSNRHLREIVEDYVHSERDRRILIRKYCDKKTIGQLAEEFDVSDTTIKNVIYKYGYMIFDIMSRTKPEN